MGATASRTDDFAGHESDPNNSFDFTPSPLSSGRHHSSSASSRSPHHLQSPSHSQSRYSSRFNHLHAHTSPGARGAHTRVTDKAKDGKATSSSSGPGSASSPGRGGGVGGSAKLQGDGHSPRNKDSKDVLVVDKNKDTDGKSKDGGTETDSDKDDDGFSIAEIKWNYGGHSVYVTGAWDSWNNKYALYRTHHNEFMAVLLLPLGTFQYKFIVDSNWKHSPSLPTERDAHGNLNNVITIAMRPKEFDSNDLGLSGWLDSGDPSGCGSDVDKNQPVNPNDYDFSILPQEDHASEPPTLPRMLASGGQGSVFGGPGVVSVGGSNGNGSSNGNNTPGGPNGAGSINNSNAAPGAAVGRNASGSNVSAGGAAAGVNAAAAGRRGRNNHANSPTPDFVRLNHIFEESNNHGVYGTNQIRTVATEMRYKTKVITALLITAKSKFVVPQTPASFPQTAQRPMNILNTPEQQLQQQQQRAPQNYHNQHQEFAPHSRSNPHPNVNANPTSSSASVGQGETQTLIMDALNNV